MYEFQRWLDHVSDPADIFIIEQIAGTKHRITPDPESVILQQGTPQDQTHFNNIESGILDAHSAFTLVFNALRQYIWAEEERTHTYTGATLLDADSVIRLLINQARFNKWDIEDIKAWMADHDITEIGTVTLTNNQKFPFNNSKVSVSFTKTRKTQNYVVLTEVTAFTGNVGEVEVSGKLTNGFQIGYTGSASAATIKYVVIGGFGE